MWENAINRLAVSEGPSLVVFNRVAACTGICNIRKVSHWMWDIVDKPEHDPLRNNNYIYIFRIIKTSNYVLFRFGVCFIYHSWMFVLLMMPHVDPITIRQYHVSYSILFYSIFVFSREKSHDSKYSKYASPKHSS